jgi:predicted mannosyl-3-phosphoglycerate phosphatase (HAD superfamily)
MIARSTPIAIKTKPDPPEDDAERLRKLREKEHRLIAGLSRTHAEIVAIEQKLGVRRDVFPNTS